MASELDLQQQLADAIAPLRKGHPEIDKNLPLSCFKEYQILDMQNPNCYLKGCWIGLMLSIIDPTIMKDKNSKELAKFINFCDAQLEKNIATATKKTSQKPHGVR